MVAHTHHPAPMRHAASAMVGRAKPPKPGTGPSSFTTGSSDSDVEEVPVKELYSKNAVSLGFGQLGKVGCWLSDT